MFKIKIFVSIITFSILLIVTSIIKNQTRETEKKILNLSKIIKIKEKDLNESELDFSYLSSPSIIHDKIKLIDNDKLLNKTLLFEFKLNPLTLCPFKIYELKYGLKSPKYNSVFLFFKFTEYLFLDCS